ncbi:MAG: NlpC/P60 family protein [Leucobacter sp.]
MTQQHSNAVALVTEASKPSSSKGKRIAQMAGAAALSFGMMGTFALPAYATNDAPVDPSVIDGFAQSQTLEAVNVDTDEVPLLVPAGEVDSAILEAERKEKEAEEAAARAAEAAQTSGTATATAAAAPAAPSGQDVPAGAGAQGIVSAALAQLGQYQDCTALVERSLRAIGIPAGDLGTQIYEYTGLGGTLVTSGDYAPGDVLIWSGRHVAVYIGNGQAVHGGYGGNQTVVASAFIDGSPSGVVRF